MCSLIVNDNIIRPMLQRDLNKKLKRTLFNKTKQYNIQIVSKIILFNYSTSTILSIKISYFRICFCTFDLSCSILEKDNFIENVCIVLS